MTAVWWGGDVNPTNIAGMNLVMGRPNARAGVKRKKNTFEQPKF